MISFEIENTNAYTLLLRIEIALRECLRHALESEFGPPWRKQLPGDLLKKIKESQEEGNRPQFDFIKLGPLYYLTFGELLKLLQQKSGRAVAARFGGDCFLKQLENLTAPRNSVCHSRPVSSVGLKVIETLYAEMEVALKPLSFSDLISSPDTGITQGEASAAMVVSLKKLLTKRSRLPAFFEIPNEFNLSILQFWWADDSLAGFNRSTVEKAFAVIHEYNALPKGVGSAASRQRCCETYQIDSNAVAAIMELQKVKG
jgi:hypothetical protein